MNSHLITVYQQSIAIGCLLGDGYLYKNGRLQIEQAAQQKLYVEWLHQQLSPLTGKISFVTRTHPKSRVISHSYRFYTSKCFQHLEHIFYTQTGKRKKVIPKNLDQLVNSSVLSIWFMDDGGKAQNTPLGAYINVTGFSSIEHTQIQDMLKNVFGLRVNIHKAGGNNQWNIYIPAKSYKAFHEIVYPVISQVPTMLYKLASIQ